MATIIRDVYKIDEDDLEALDGKALESDYWQKSYEFVMQVMDKDITALTDKQQLWLEKILDGIR